MSELSEETKKLIKKYQNYEKEKSLENNESTIHVDEVTSKVASFYEKIRGIIDWKEEHLLKRSAIERSLKRRVLPNINLSDGKLSQETISAEPLVLELIRSGHFPNDKISENKIKEIQKIINKYIYFINNSPIPKKDSRIQFYQWLLSIAACEIEEILSPASKQRALMDYMYNSLKNKVKLNSKIIEKNTNFEKDKDVLIYINTQKVLFDLDLPVISYHLIKYKYPELFSKKKKKIKEIANNFPSIKEKIESYLDHPLDGKIYQVCQKYNTPYLILGEIIENNLDSAQEEISNPEKLELLIKNNYNKRLKTLKSRLKRAAFYSTLSIFVTNVFALLLIEIPLSQYYWNYSGTTHEIVIFNTTLPMAFLLVTIFVPTLLMAFLVLTIKPPGKGNLEKVIMETIKIVYSSDKKEQYEIKHFRKRGELFNLIISLVYLISFLFSLGVIVWVLSKINFPPFSYLIFIIFLSLIAFTGIKIREKAKELQMVEEKEGFLGSLVDFFALPILYLGKWLSLRWKKYNIISTFFNALLDMPFSIFIEFLEQWRFFLKEKKEKL